MLFAVGVVIAYLLVRYERKKTAKSAVIEKQDAQNVQEVQEEQAVETTIEN